MAFSNFDNVGSVTRELREAAERLFKAIERSGWRLGYRNSILSTKHYKITG